LTKIVPVDLTLRVTSVRAATPSARIVRVALGGAPFNHRAGQLAMIGPPESATRVPYSIASAPEETREHGWLEFLIKVDAAGRWGAHFPALRRGMRLAVRGPYGTFIFPEHPRERWILFIAGGTGISPLRSMLVHAVAGGAGGRIRVLYSARSPLEFAYARDLRAMARKGDIEVVFTATREVPQLWRGLRGRIAPAQLAAMVDDPSTLCFVCGPTAMVADVPPMLRKLGIGENCIHVEKW
jgi:NAD(P)H-flavin reductase